MTKKSERLYTVTQVVKLGLLGYGARTIRKLMKDGLIRYIKVTKPGAISPTFRIPESAITEFLEKNAQQNNNAQAVEL